MARLSRRGTKDEVKMGSRLAAMCLGVVIGAAFGFGVALFFKWGPAATGVCCLIGALAAGTEGFVKPPHGINWHTDLNDLRKPPPSARRRR